MLAQVVLVGRHPPDEGPDTSGAELRTVEVTMLDNLRFEPSSLEVGVGETVRFVLTNDGAIVHVFSLGDATDHGGGMSDMGGTGSGTTGPAVVLEPGESGELTNTFDEADEVGFACHQPGHIEAGMVFRALVA